MAHIINGRTVRTASFPRVCRSRRTLHIIAPRPDTFKSVHPIFGGPKARISCGQNSLYTGEQPFKKDPTKPYRIPFEGCWAMARINIRILHSGSKAQDPRDSRNHGLQDLSKKYVMYYIPCTIYAIY